MRFRDTHSEIGCSFLFPHTKSQRAFLHKVRLESCGGEAWVEHPPAHSVRQRELDLGVVELLDRWATAFVGSNVLHAHDLNGVGTGPVTSSHVTI